MKKFKIILWLCMPLFVLSCIQEGYDTIVLNEKNPLDEVVPVETRFEMEQYMPIYSGNTPPIIEGTYLISEDELVYTSDGVYDSGEIFLDLTLRFKNQNSSMNTLEFDEKQGDSYAESEEVIITGEGDDFTTYFVATGESYDIDVKMATIISGTKTSKGIRNFFYAFVMLEKGYDGKNQLMEEGAFRIFKDGDGTAEKTTWSKSVELSPSLLKQDMSIKSIYQK